MVKLITVKTQLTFVDQLLFDEVQCQGLFYIPVKDDMRLMD